MTDIFENTILCKTCKSPMKPLLINKNGFNLRALRCNKCNHSIVHPTDKQEYEEFMRLKNKEFNVKMRMVGNSYAVSIPREIVDFMKEQEKIMDNMVRLCFEEAGRISMRFNNPENLEGSDPNSRIIKSREVKIVRNDKPVLHTKQFYDSKHPERNQNKVIKSENLEEEDIEDGR